MLSIPYSERTFFDGSSFESMGIVVERVHDDLPEMVEEMESYRGRHGSRVLDIALGTREITLECRAMLDTWPDFDALMADLASWLVTPDDRKLVVRTHPDQYYMAHYRSITEGERQGGTGVGGFEIVFTAADPIRYGEERALVHSGSDSQAFEVGGTENADMTITVRGAARSSDGYLSLRVSKTTMRVKLPNSTGNTVSFDLSSHRVTVNGNAAGLTISSDWPTITPGRHTISISEGSGTATLSWVQRYR